MVRFRHLVRCWACCRRHLPLRRPSCQATCVASTSCASSRAAERRFQHATKQPFSTLTKGELADTGHKAHDDRGPGHRLLGSRP